MNQEQKKHIKAMCKKIAKESVNVSELDFYKFLGTQREFIKDDLKYNYFATELKNYLKKHPAIDIHKFGVSS